MANDFNPGFPDVLGLQWDPIWPRGLNYAADSPWAVVLRSRSAETIEKLRWPIRATNTTNQHMLIVDIYELGKEMNQPGSTVKSIEYSPNSDASVGAWKRRADGLTTNLFQKINENPVQYPPIRTDYGIFTETAHDIYRCRVDSGAFPLTARVVRVAFRYVISAMGYEWRPTNAFLHWEGAGGPLLYNIPGAFLTTHYYGILHEVDLGEINPRTLRPWIPQDIRDFSITSGWQMRFQAVANTVSPVQLISASLRVYYTDTEHRKAAAIWRRPAADLSRPRAVESDTITTMPGGTSNWAKANALDYSFVHRLAADHVVQYTSPRSNDVAIDSLADPGTHFLGGERDSVPVPGMKAGFVTLDPLGQRVIQVNKSRPTPGNYSGAEIPAIMLIKAGPTVSDDSQPYGHGWWTTSSSNEVRSGRDEYQEMSPASTQTYLGVEFMVKPPQTADGTLTVQVKTTGGANVGGSFTITADAVRAMTPAFFEHRLVSGWLSSGAALTGGTAYRLTFSSDVVSTDPFYIATAGVPDSFYTALGTTPPNGDTATFQGATGLATHNAATDAAIDLCARLLKQPTALGAPTATVVTVATDTPPEFCELHCDPAEIEVVDFTWTASAYTGFVRWVVQREEADKPGVWVTLRHITVEATKTYRDWGARRTIAVRYRARAELSNGSFTDWATSGQVAPQPKNAEMIFTSDADPTLTVAYDREPLVTYSFLKAEEDVFVTMAGTDFQRVYATPRNRGQRFTYDLTVNMINEPAADRKGPEAFDPLRAIAESTEIPYVIVLDHEGHRWFAHLQVPEGVSEQPEHVYTTTVTVTEITDTPVITTEP